MKNSYSMLMMAVVFGLAAICPASAQPAAYDAGMTTEATSPAPTPMTSGNIQYISGGISDGGMSAMKAQEGNYNLKMLFVAGGEYLANVSVNIKDAKKNDVLNATLDGPVLLAKMPAGSYDITARTDDGQSMERHVRIGSDRLSSYVLRYPPRND